MASLGDKIIEFRKRKGLSQGELASLLHIHQSMVTRWEKNQVQPRNTTLEKLAEILGTTVEELIAGRLGKDGAAVRNLADPQLAELLNQLHRLSPRDVDALKAVIEAMLTKSRVQEAIGA